MSDSKNFFRPEKEPLKAAFFSLIPGAGQFYNGQSLKGFLFIDVALVNFILLWIVLFAQPMSNALRGIFLSNHMRLNEGVLSALNSARLGGPFSIILLTLFFLFVAYAARDAYDNAAKTQKRLIYANSVIEISEAASGSYLLHCAVICCFLILALFFLIPKPADRQTVEISFRDTKTEEQKPIRTQTLSNHNSRAKGNIESNKPKLTLSARSESSSAQSRAAQNESRSIQPSRNEQPRTETKKEQRNEVKERPRSETEKQQQIPLLRPNLPTVHSAVSPQPRLPVPLPPNPVHSMTSRLPAPLPTLSSPTISSNSKPIPFPIIATNAPSIPLAQPISPTGSATAGGPMPAPSSARAGQVGAANIAPAAMPASSPGSISNSPAAPQPLPRSASGSTRSHDDTRDAPAPQKVAYNSPGLLRSFSPVGASRSASTGNNNATTVGSEKGDGASADAKKVDFGLYMAELERRIKHNWTPPKIPMSKRTVVTFQISRSGELSHLRVTSSSGSSDVDEAAVKAVTELPF